MEGRSEEEPNLRGEGKGKDPKDDNGQNVGEKEEMDVDENENDIYGKRKEKVNRESDAECKTDEMEDNNSVSNVALKETIHLLADNHDQNQDLDNFEKDSSVSS